ncbi:ubiquitin-conjugating enzyme/RWD-like protein [Phlyctochytrium arcticum]|nr:ubiquitin-conjugating enzyme/RWD-like protein [Phlyctochytrium arcticum]
MPDIRRVEREIRQVQADRSAKVWVKVLDDNLSTLSGTIGGPDGSPYEGGEFSISINLPNEYPFHPPVMKFETPVYHPNISSQTGAICLDILKNEWSPVLTLKTVLLSLQSLLCDPAPDNPQDAQVAQHYITNRADFERTARKWTEMYAIKVDAKEGKSRSGNSGTVDEATSVSQIHQMGFDQDLVILALRRYEGDEQQAVEAILTGSI